MKTGLSILAVLALSASIAHADDSSVPVGTLIYDAEPLAAPAALETEALATEPLFAIQAPAPAVPETVKPAAEAAPLLTIPVAEIAPASSVPLVTESVQTQASIRSVPLTVLPPGQVDPGRIVPQVDLAPGETIVQVLAVPTMVRVPDAPVAQPVSFMAPVAIEPEVHHPKVDPVTGRLRDTPGWTGRTDSAAGVGCFPEGSCASLGN